MECLLTLGRYTAGWPCYWPSPICLSSFLCSPLSVCCTQLLGGERLTGERLSEGHISLDHSASAVVRAYLPHHSNPCHDRLPNAR